MGPAGGYREPHRRRRKHRRRTGLPFSARRLHPALVTAAAACDQSQSVPQARLRSDEVRACHRHGSGAERADRQSEQHQGNERARVDRIPEGQFRQDHLRHAGQRHDLASDLGAVSAAGKGEAAAHSVSRLGACAARSRRRRRRRHVRQSRRLAGAGSGRQAEAARGGLVRPSAGAAGCTHDS